VFGRDGRRWPAPDRARRNQGHYRVAQGRHRVLAYGMLRDPVAGGRGKVRGVLRAFRLADRRRIRL